MVRIVDGFDVAIWIVNFINKHPWILLVLALFGFLLNIIYGDGTKSVPDAAQTKPPVEETLGNLVDLDDLDNMQSYQDDGFVFPNGDTELIDKQEAANLSDSDLTYAINEIYARHGYIFRNAELRGYYEQFSWYTGEISADEFSVDCFNQIEQQNWNLLVNERNRRRSSD